MDHVTVNIVQTVVAFIMFVGIVIWAFSKKTKPRFDEAANLIFDDEKPQDVDKENQESKSND